MSESIFFEGHESATNYKSIFFWCVFASLITFGLAIVFVIPYLGINYLKWKNTKYKVTSERIQIEKGIISKTINNLELWRINDIQFKQSILQRIFSEASVIMATQDVSCPVIIISGIGSAPARTLFDSMQTAISSSRKDHKVVSISG